MTSFIDDNGNELDYNGRDFAMSKQTISLINFKLKGDFSVNFKLQNTAKNREILNVYGAQQIGGGFMVRQPFNLVKNGNKRNKGFIVVQVYSDDELDCFYVSGNSNWFNLLQTPIKELELNEDSVLMTGFQTELSNTKGIIFPAIDVAFNGRKISTNIKPFLWPPPGRPGGGSNWNSFLTENIPCYYMHSLMSAIAVQTGVKIEGDIFNDPLFKSIVITPDSIDMQWPDNQVSESMAFVTVASASSLDPGIYTPIMFDTIIDSGSLSNYNTATYEWMAPYKCMVEVTPNLFFTASDTYTIAVYKNGVLIVLQTMANAADRFSRPLLVNQVNRGDTLSVYVRNSGGVGDYTADSTCTFKIRQEIYTLLRSSSFTNYHPMVCPQAILPDLKCIDVVKSICVLFNCIPTYDVESNTVTLTKVTNISKESAKDWSAYYVSHKENYKDVASHNYIKWKASNDDKNIMAYNSVIPQGYGGADIETDFNGEDRKTQYTLPFGAVEDKTNETTGRWHLPYIPYFELKDEDEYEYTSVTNTAGRATFTGTGWETRPDVVIRIADDGNLYDGYTEASLGPTTTTPFIPYTADSTGSIYTQSINRLNPGSRLLMVMPNYATTNLGISSLATNAIRYNDSAISTYAFGWFDKDKYYRPVDAINWSLSMGTIGNKGYNHTLADLYWDKLLNAYNSPEIDSVMLLPDYEFDIFLGNEFIYLNTEKLTGYFICESIDNFENGSSPVKVKLYKID